MYFRETYELQIDVRNDDSKGEARTSDFSFYRCGLLVILASKYDQNQHKKESKVQYYKYTLPRCVRGIFVGLIRELGEGGGGREGLFFGIWGLREWTSVFGRLWQRYQVCLSHTEHRKTERRCGSHRKRKNKKKERLDAEQVGE